jgi:hypothetical protein
MEKMEYKAMVVYQREVQDLFETPKRLRSLYDMSLGKEHRVTMLPLNAIGYREDEPNM